jgi:hypothetical protein
MENTSKASRHYRIWLLAGVATVLLGLTLWASFGWLIRDWLADLPIKLTSQPIATANVCGQAVKPPSHYDHVIWITEENKSLSQVIGSPKAPFISSLAKQCGYSTKYTDNVPRPSWSLGYHSMSHYLAAVAGSNCESGNNRRGTGCLYNDAIKPAQKTLSTVSIFQQLKDAGYSWKSYQESSPRNCSLTNRGLYAARHDAALFFSAIRPDCSASDIAIPTLTNGQNTPTGQLIQDIKNNKLPTFAYVTPNLNNDMHNGSVKLGDAWLQAYLEPLFASADYKKGSIAVFIIWDEAPRVNQTLPNMIIAPSVHGGGIAVPVNGFAVLGATEDLLGLQRLGCATGTPLGAVGQCYSGATTDLRAVFGF